MTTSQPTPPADVVDPQGEPRWGSYTGPFARVDLSAVARRKGKLFALTREKRWFYAMLTTDELLIGLAITDLTYSASSFLFVTSLGADRRSLATFSALGLPRVGCHVGDQPEEGCDAWFKLPNAGLSVRRPVGQTAYDVVAHTPAITLYATLETRDAPAPHGAIVKPAGSPVMVTTKRVLMPVRGEVSFGKERRSLDGALAGIDYTHGFPPRATTWHWAFLQGKTTDGRAIGLNLVSGFNGPPECVLWLGDTSYPLGEGRFTHGDDLLAPWQIRTDDGRVDLTFEPVANHREDHNLGLVASKFAQPQGLYRGRIDVPGKGTVQLERVPGVAERQEVRW